MAYASGVQRAVQGRAALRHASGEMAQWDSRVREQDHEDDRGGDGEEAERRCTRKLDMQA